MFLQYIQKPIQLPRSSPDSIRIITGKVQLIAMIGILKGLGVIGGGDNIVGDGVVGGGNDVVGGGNDVVGGGNDVVGGSAAGR